MNAKVFTGTFRPIPLKRYLVCEKKVFSENRKVVRSLISEKGDVDGILPLIMEVRDADSCFFIGMASLICL